jgi:GNAT superfamily N-acetyltransferase
MSDVIIRPLDLERDAEGLAAMWNASDLQWPGSWTDGVPITAQDVREWEQEERNLVVYVAEVDGEIAGYCSFDSGHHGPANEGYLGLLNVHPKYQKNSVGRRLIQATIERSVQEGWPRQTLGTWPANFKAVPTYKKTGHFWRPDTAVWMQNFVPGVLQMPIAQAFFERHNWYRCYARALEQHEDDERWEGMKVYTMRWQAEGESLTIWIDREALAPTAIETDEVLVAAIASELEPLNGSQTALHWRIANKRDEPLQVHVRALGGDGLEIDHHEAFVVPPRGTVEHVASVKVGESAPRSKPYGVAPAVRSIVTLDHLDVELSTGLRPRKPLSLETDPGQISLTPGVAGDVALQLHNETEAAVQGALYLTLPEGVTADWTRREVEAPARGWLRVPLRLTCADEAAYALPVHWAPADPALKPVDETLTVFAVAVGGLVAQQTGKGARVETDALRLTVEAKEGTATLTHKDSDETLTRLGHIVGPPYWPSVFRDTEMEVALAQRAGRALVHTWAESSADKGLVMHRELALAPNGMMTVRVWLENRGSQRYARRCRLGLQPWERGKVWCAAPLHGSVVYEQTAIYPQVRYDLPRDPATYDEPWCAVDHEGVALGFAWGEGVDSLNMGWGFDVDSREVTVEPGQRAEAMHLAVWAGRGDWRQAREMALRWRGLWNPKVGPPRVRLAGMARLEPRVLTTVKDIAEARLVVDSVSNRALDGQAVIHAPAGVTAQLSVLPVQGLKRGVRLEQDVRLSLPPVTSGVWSGQTRLELPVLGGEQPYHVVRLGSERPVSVRPEERQGQGVWVVDNGAGALVVAPDFGPSIISWTWRGQEQLHSFFPEPQGYSWFYPWFGGLHATIKPAEGEVHAGYLHRQKVAAQPLDAPDAAGIPWRGVRLSVRPEKQELHDLVVELDWLTVGDSPVCKFVYRVHNLRPTGQRVQLLVRATCGLGGTPADLILRSQGEERHPTNWASWRSGARWGLLTHRGSGRSLALVSSEPCVSVDDMGRYGRVVGLDKTARLAGDGIAEMTAYFVLADSPDEALRYRVLGES